jgi:hypothetical protein
MLKHAILYFVAGALLITIAIYCVLQISYTFVCESCPPNYISQSPTDYWCYHQNKTEVVYRRICENKMDDVWYLIDFIFALIFGAGFIIASLLTVLDYNGFYDRINN